MPGRFLVCAIEVQHKWAPGVTRTSEFPLGVARGGRCLHSSPAQPSTSAQSHVSDFPSLPPLGMQPSILLLLEAPQPFPPGEGALHTAPAPHAPPGPSPLNFSIIFLPLPSALLPFHLPFLLPHGLPLIFKCSYSSPSFSGGNFNKCTNICYS